VQEVAGDRAVSVALGVASEGSNYHSLAWAPDSENLAFVSFAGLPPGSDYKLSLFSLDEEESRLVYESEDSIAGMKWSPDGNSLAVVEGERLLLVHLDGGDDVVVEDGVALFPLSGNGLAWSPDGHRLICPVAVGQASELHVVEVSTLEETVLWPNSDARMAFIPSWSPDGQRIAILKGRYLVVDPSEERVSLIVVDADGSHPMEMDLAGEAFELGTELLWSPDGTQLAAMSRRGTAVDVWVMPVEAVTARQLTQTGNVQKIIRWTTDGEAVLISTWEAIEVIPVGS
jgi:Tol biopolymer transport system component